MQGLKIRTTPNPAHVEAFKLLGAESDANGVHGGVSCARDRHRRWSGESHWHHLLAALQRSPEVPVADRARLHGVDSGDESGPIPETRSCAAEGAGRGGARCCDLSAQAQSGR